MTQSLKSGRDLLQNFGYDITAMKLDQTQRLTFIQALFHLNKTKHRRIKHNIYLTQIKAEPLQSPDSQVKSRTHFSCSSWDVE